MRGLERRRLAFSFDWCRCQQLRQDRKSRRVKSFVMCCVVLTVCTGYVSGFQSPLNRTSSALADPRPKFVADHMVCLQRRSGAEEVLWGHRGSQLNALLHYHNPRSRPICLKTICFVYETKQNRRTFGEAKAWRRWTRGSVSEHWQFCWTVEDTWLRTTTVTYDV